MSKKMVYYFFIGTVAELIKIMPVTKEMSDRGLNFKIIASGQNDIHTSELLAFGGIRKIDITLSNGKIKQSPIGLLNWFVSTYRSAKKTLAAEFIDPGNKIIIVHGDTVSTLMGAWLGKNFKVRVAHIEAGLRSYNYFHPFPEEIDRVLTSKIAKYHFCPNQWAVNNIKHKSAQKIDTGGNTLIDSLAIATAVKELPANIEKITQGDYCVFVMHRQENLMNQSLVNFLLERVEEISKTRPVVFVLHGPTRATLEKMNKLDMLKRNRNVRLIPRTSYLHFMKILDRAEFIITDGGSNQEESYYLGKPCLILRKATERIEGLDENVVLSKNDPATISEFIKNYRQYQKPKISPKNRPSKIIVDYLSGEL